MQQIERLLLVEDDPLVANVVRLALPHLDVVVARTREEALGLLTVESEWCGALVDLNLTEHTADFRGRDVLEVLKDTDIPRAVLTGAKGIGDIRRNFQVKYGVTTVVIKGDRGIELGDIRDCVSEMVALSVSAARQRLQRLLDKTLLSIDDKYSGESQALEYLRVRTSKLAGRDAAERVVRHDLEQIEAQHATHLEILRRIQDDLNQARTRAELAELGERLERELPDA